MNAVIIQCRLGSTRLPEKALLQINNIPVIVHVMQVMLKVHADFYYLATDEKSYEKLHPLATENGFECFKGSESDVLDRFCTLIKTERAKGKDITTIIRATGDNPYLFSDAAQDTLTEYYRLKETQKVDYFTFSGLPHGSGVEVIDADSLLLAEQQTNLPYDREHVGPSLYNHKDNFSSVFMKAPSKYNYPDLRTTIDTKDDYLRAIRAFKRLSEILEIDNSGQNSISNDIDEITTANFSTEQIVKVFSIPHIMNPVLLVPEIENGNGTGHFRRCLSLAEKNGYDIYFPCNLECHESIKELRKDSIKKNETIASQFIESIENIGYLTDYHLVLTDSFSISNELLQKLKNIAPVASIDEGSVYHDLCDVLIDIIPSMMERKANITDVSLIPLPKNKRVFPNQIKQVLISLGGENSIENSSLIESKINKTFTNNEIQITILKSPVENLKEELHNYDLVITHYGFTAFESLSADCAVLLFATTPLHQQLAKKYGFCCIDRNTTQKQIKEYFLNPSQLSINHKVFENIKNENDTTKDLSSFVLELSKSRVHSCPVCKNNRNYTNKFDKVVSRATNKTIRTCNTCGMQYISWQSEQKMSYSKSYFFEDYKKQYGKTYLEDFESIKQQGIRRHKVIQRIRKSGNTVLDIGCAYGTYLQAASDLGWKPFGIDISEDAINYVKNELHFKATTSQFPDFHVEKAFARTSFDAVTMWYVIEHFTDLDAVLNKVSSLLSKNGVFAFSTPCADGVSGRFSKDSFYEQSPIDHYSIWQYKTAKKVLKKYGLKIVKVVSTGQHPERFPCVSSSKRKNKMVIIFLGFISRIFKLGDTFEIYCKKI